MTFQAAVEATPEVKNSWRPGLQALRRRDRQHIEVEDTRYLSGSVDLDSTLRDSYPDEPRWDYAVGYRRDRSGETVYWIEIHPATSGEVQSILHKLGWLRNWLRTVAPRLDEMRKEFIWMSSGRTSLTLSSPQCKRFALQGLRHVGSTFRIRNSGDN